MLEVLALSLAVSLGPVVQFVPSGGAYGLPEGRTQDQDQNQQPGDYVPYSPEQLDNLVAPIALYPDPLLAQVLVAATFPDEIDEAARYVRSNGQGGIDDQDWDVSVKAVAHYPSVLNMMENKIDWTTALGQAYVNQSTDVMSSVQHLRGMARAQGNLGTGPQIDVEDVDGNIDIWPANPQYIFVPVYDPAIVYFQRPLFGIALGFGPRFAIGAWLNYDCDWRGHRIYYTGWQGRGWIERSRPFIRVTNVYVNDRYRNVQINRGVIDRHVNYENVNRFNNVHREVNFDNHDRSGRVPRPDSRVNNQVINRNIPSNTRVNDFRGRAPQPLHPPERPTQPSGVEPRSARPVQPPQQRPPQPPPVVRPPTVSPEPHPFARNEGQFPPREAGQRGQASRATPPAPPPRPSPPRPSAPSRSPGRAPGKH